MAADDHGERITRLEEGARYAHRDRDELRIDVKAHEQQVSELRTVTKRHGDQLNSLGNLIREHDTEHTSALADFSRAVDLRFEKVDERFTALSSDRRRALATALNILTVAIALAGLVFVILQFAQAA